MRNWLTPSDTLTKTQQSNMESDPENEQFDLDDIERQIATVEIEIDHVEHIVEKPIWGSRARKELYRDDKH